MIIEPLRNSGEGVGILLTPESSEEHDVLVRLSDRCGLGMEERVLSIIHLADDDGCDVTNCVTKSRGIEYKMNCKVIM